MESHSNSFKQPIAAERRQYAAPEVVFLGRLVETTRGGGPSDYWDVGTGRKSDPDDY